MVEFLRKKIIFMMCRKEDETIENKPRNHKNFPCLFFFSLVIAYKKETLFSVLFTKFTEKISQVAVFF